MRIVFKFPSRSRPQRMFNTIDNIFSLTKTDDWCIILTLDVDDPSVNNEEVFEKIKSYGEKVIPDFGISGSKTIAINRGLEKLGNFDVLILQSDDIEWTKEGFDEQIISDMLLHAPDTDIFLHYFDGRQRNTSILNIVGREYFKRQNYIYFSGYTSVYSDNEETEKARLRGKYKFIDKIMYVHNHPIHRGVAWDEQYRASEHPINYAKDGALFRSRQAINFGI